ncbi:glycosyltransferase [Asanoa sp. NPDC049573]|uniref:glycosyltransferase n=1 Tax=Asanoa sp. NPDC049573 TaxID=3155396 RepID=UPI00341B8EAB
MISAEFKAAAPERLAGAVGTRVVRLGDSALVVAGSTDHLRDVAAGPFAAEPTRRVRIVVAYWRHTPWSAPVAPAPHLVRHRVARPHLRRGTAVVTLRYARPVPLGDAVRSALTALAPTHPRVPVRTHRTSFDATRINPRGRRPAAYRPDAPRLVLDSPGFDATTLARLRDTRTVTVGAGTGPAALAALCATGVLVDAAAVPPSTRAALHPDLLTLLDAPAPAGDPLAIEARSVRQRRAALRHHAAGLAATEPPPVSAILATRRPELLGPALAMLAGQTYPRLEIVLCLHGVAAPPGLAAALGGRPHQIVEVPAEASFGTALGLATARAGGTLVTKVDDDDTYGPEHLWDLVLARHYSGATLVGKGSELVFLESRGTVLRRRSGVPEAFGEMVSGGTMLLAKADVTAVGGWRPVPRSVDLGLIQRLVRAGGTIYRTHPLGYVYHRRATGHTWDPGVDYFLQNASATWPSIPPDALA